MAKRPQCNISAWSLYKETGYSTAIAPDTRIDQWFEPNEPLILEMSQERTDDAALVKGQEFPTDINKDIVVAQDVSMPFSFPSSLDVLGLLLSLVTGTDSATGAPSDYTHIYLPEDLCTTDQIASSNVIIGLKGDTASYKLLKGLIVDSLTITMDSQNWLTVSGTVFTDGTLTDKAAFTFPVATDAIDFIVGTQSDFFSDDAPQPTTPTSKQSILRGFEFSISNNLDIGDARGNVASAGKFLGSLRPGNREYSLSVTVEGHQGDEFWDDYEAETEKSIQLHVEKSATRYLDILSLSTVITNISQSFEGIRDVQTIDYKMFYVDQGTAQYAPAMVTVANGVAAYLL